MAKWSPVLTSETRALRGMVQLVDVEAALVTACAHGPL
jgi:hypothetical protein